MILNQEQRANLREFFDHDKTNVFELFMKTLQDQIRKQPMVGPDQWATNIATISRQAQIDCITEILRLLEEEMADQDVEVDDAQ